MNKEKNALRILKGLRYKFARELDEPKNYTSDDLHKMLSVILKKIDNNQVVEIKTEKYPSDIWDKVDEQIERSKIKRYPWKAVFGKSLTQEILNLKKKGLTVKEAYVDLMSDKRFKEFLQEAPRRERANIIKNLETSVHARYGENNTANKVMGAKLTYD